MSISDEFGNEVIHKSEKDGTGVERDYVYGESDEDDELEGNDASGQLVEERTYGFMVQGNKIIVNAQGAQ